MVAQAGDKQCEVVLVGCGAPGRGMGWYHAEQLLKNQCPSAKLCYVVEPWFLGAGERAALISAALRLRLRSSALFFALLALP